MNQSYQNVTKLLPSAAKSLITGKGKEVVRQVGLDIIRDIIVDVLCGKNLRDSTEVITRKKLATINAATLVMFLRGETKNKGFTQHLPGIAADALTKKLSSEERQIMQWLLGLTNKATQNVLRDNTDSVNKYAQEYRLVCKEVVSLAEADYGKLKGVLSLDSKYKADVDWAFIVEFLQTIGAQTLAIRGSEKSTYGKLFEKLILGSLLEILGFTLVQKNNISLPRRVFWLSSVGNKRESDATLIYKPGVGVRFDIGFIGRGNPEISLDKVSRFERQIELGSKKYAMATIILVDAIGKKSKITQLATKIDGTIIQMSMSYWPKLVAKVLNERFGFSSELVKIPDKEIQEYLQEKVKSVSLERLITGSTNR